MALIDIHDPRIERQIGDRHKRTPHFVVKEDAWAQGDRSGVLYWPDPTLPECPKGVTRLEWLAKAFKDIDEAATFLAKSFPMMAEGRK